MRIARLLLPVLAFFLAGGAAAATPGNVLVSPDRTEPVVATDPNNPNLVIAAANTNYDVQVNGHEPVAFFTSTNGGQSFTTGYPPVIAPWTVEADPSLVINRHSTGFFTYLAESPTFCSAAGGSAIILSRSYDHGRSFGAPTIVDNNPQDDKPFMAVEDFPAVRSHIFVSWTRQEGNQDAIWVSRSLNGGDTFSPPLRLYISTNNNFGSVPVVGAHGRIYVIWSSYPDLPTNTYGTARLLYRVSTDDGAHFGPVRRIGNPFPILPPMAMPGYLREETMPGATAAPDGTVYVTWSQLHKKMTGGEGEADIMISRTTNGGTSWSSPKRVNDVRGYDRFMPAPSVLSDGSIGVAFYDRRGGWDDLATYAGRVSFRHGFHRWANVRVSRGIAPIGDIYFLAPGQSSCFFPGRFFGDYIGSSPGSGNSLNVVWAGSQSHVADRTDIWFARVDVHAPVGRSMARRAADRCSVPARLTISRLPSRGM